MAEMLIMFINVDERLRPATVSERIVFSITWADMIRGEREDSERRVTIDHQPDSARLKYYSKAGCMDQTAQDPGSTYFCASGCVNGSDGSRIA